MINAFSNLALRRLERRIDRVERFLQQERDKGAGESPDIGLLYKEIQSIRSRLSPLRTTWDCEQKDGRIILPAIFIPLSLVFLAMFVFVPHLGVANLPLLALEVFAIFLVFALVDWREKRKLLAPIRAYVERLERDIEEIGTMAPCAGL